MTKVKINSTNTYDVRKVLADAIEFKDWKETEKVDSNKLEDFIVECSMCQEKFSYKRNPDRKFSAVVCSSYNGLRFRVCCDECFIEIKEQMND